jgi:hypothetical protein
MDSPASHIVVSPDTRTVYLLGNRLVTVEARRSAGLRLIDSTRQAWALSVPPDGRWAYRAESTDIATDARDQHTGRLTLATRSTPINLPTSSDGAKPAWTPAHLVLARGGLDVYLIEESDDYDSLLLLHPT